MLNILSSLFAIDCCWTPTESSRHPHTSVSVLSRLQFSHQMPGLMWVVTKVRPVLRWSRPGPAAASSVLVTGWLRHEPGHIGHLVTRRGPRGPRMSRGATRHYCCCCSFNITANGIVWRSVTGTGCPQYEWHSPRQSLGDTLCWPQWSETLPRLQAWSGSGEQRVITAETLGTGNISRVSSVSSSLVTSRLNIMWPDTRAELRTLGGSIDHLHQVTQPSNWPGMHFRLPRPGQSFSRHQVWMFARPSESKLVAGRFACCVSYLGNCCHAISGGRVKLTITIKTPRMIKDFQEIFSFLFFNFFTVSSWAWQ